MTNRKGLSSISVDFYLPQYNVVVEVNGVQHYKPSSFGNSKVDTAVAFNKQLNRDETLRATLAAKKIRLIEIPYDMNRVDIMKIFSELQC